MRSRGHLLLQCVEVSGGDSVAEDGEALDAEALGGGRLGRREQRRGLHAETRSPKTIGYTSHSLPSVTGRTVQIDHFVWTCMQRADPLRGPVGTSLRLRA